MPDSEAYYPVLTRDSIRREPEGCGDAATRLHIFIGLASALLGWFAGVLAR